MATQIHRLSPRAKAPFVTLNCAAISESLLESELFGHERGAFTGATDAKAGLLEMAPGGTVFLDEIAEMPAKLQAKLLRVLETREIQRVGSVKMRAIDVRFVAATNRDLEADIAEGKFRRDLYYRLNGITVHIPPLRERRGEILPLVRSFLARFAREADRAAPDVSPEAARLLENYPWPGNVREVRNVVERALLLCEGSEILPEHLPIESMAAHSVSFAAAPPAAPFAAAPPVVDAGRLSPTAARPTAPAGVFDEERDRILRVLAEHGGNQTQAAKALGIARSTLIARLESYGVPRPRKPGE
jgi:transcriptional regulator with PAS, ATPase and Fis domain